MIEAESALNEEIKKLQEDGVTEKELQKVKNKTESMMAFEDMSLMNRASSLAYYELLGDASWFNFELEKYASVTTEDILQESRNIFRQANSNTMYYLSDN